jgi:hypothetical protein
MGMKCTSSTYEQVARIKEGHKKEATKSNPMGGVEWGKERCRGAAKVIDHKLYQFSLTLYCTPPTSLASMNDTTILYSGCTSIFLSETSPCMNTRAANVPLHVSMQNVTSIHSSHTSELLLSAFYHQARWAHLLSRLAHNSLISINCVTVDATSFLQKTMLK